MFIGNRLDRKVWWGSPIAPSETALFYRAFLWVKFMISFDSEKDLESFICDSLEESHNPISDETICFFTRQMEIKGYGIADIITITRDVHPETQNTIGMEINIIELKNANFKKEDVGQIARYKRGIERAISTDESLDDMCVSVRCTLVFKKTFPDQSNGCYLIHASEWLEAYEFSMSPRDGVKFSSVDPWVSSNEDIKSISQSILKIMEK